MPICPGCERTVSYRDLDIHQRYCRGLGEDAAAGERTLEQIETRLRAIERLLEARFKQFETELDQRLKDLDQRRRAR